MTNFFVFLLFAGIGSIFGPVGFFIGLILGIFGWIGAANKKTESKSVPAKKEVPIFTGIEHKVSSTPEFQSTANPGSEQAAEYATVTSYLYAYILCFYPVNDTSKVDEVTDLLRKDDWILDKSKTLDEVAERLSIIQIERRDSPMLFKLHSEALLERTLRLPRPMKSRLLMQLDSLSTGLGESEPKDCREFISKFQKALRKEFSASSGRIDAEAFIMRSGDSKAISTLQEMYRNPSRYRNILRSSAASNNVLKIALGVFSGMLAAEVAKAAISDYQMKNLISQLDKDFEKAGGLDNVVLEDKELESLETPDFRGEPISSFNDSTDGSAWENESIETPLEEETTEVAQVDDLDSSSNESEVSEPEVDFVDSGRGFSFDYD